MVATFSPLRTFNVFGIKTNSTHTAVDNIIGYTGKLFDDKTGLQNNLNRWYEATTGKWISKDPIAADMNLYRYCGNGPIKYVDPLGLNFCTAECKKDQKPADDFINKLFGDVINNAAAKPGATNQSIQDAILNGLMIPGIEKMIEDAIKDGKIEGVGSTAHIPLLGGIDLVGASAIKLCGQCVGTDKLDHFLNTGLDYYNIKKDKGEDYALAFGYWTEGIKPPGMTQAIYDWLYNETHSVTVNGHAIQVIGSILWGNLGDQTGIGGIGNYVVDPYGSASPADLAANTAGMDFWDDIMGTKPGQFKKFDICSYITKDWDQTQNHNRPGPPRGKDHPSRPWR